MLVSGENKRYSSTSLSLLKQIVIIAILCSLSIVLHRNINKFLGLTMLPLHLRKYLFFDFIGMIPLLFIPLYTRNKLLNFIGVSSSEAIGFWLFGSKIYPFSLILNFIYGFCWGVLPIYFLKSYYLNFSKTYSFILLLFIIHFFLFKIFGILLVFNHLLSLSSIFSFFSNDNLSSFSFNVLKKLSFVLIIQFFSLFWISFVVTVLYIRIKKHIIVLL
ncbi:MAG: hypothetical protein Q8888_00785 [Vigna little leaf phytoplasma]|nr:hypothetical protein [Vigna little leaf phytoplasma]